MGAQSSIQKSIIGQGKLDFKLDWLHPFRRGVSSADWLSISPWNSPQPALLGSISFSQEDIFRGGEHLDILLEKGISDSNYVVDFRRPIGGRDGQKSITIKNTLTPATSIHGIATNSFGSVYGGVRMHRLSIEVDQKWSPNPKLTNTAGIRIEQVGPIDDYGNILTRDSYGCPITFSGNPYDKMFIYKLGIEYTDSNNDNFSQYKFLLELGLPFAPYWLRFKRLKVHRRQGVRLGPTFAISSIQGGTVTGDLGSYNAFPIGGFNSVRGYGEGAVGTGQSYVVATNELSLPLTTSLQGVIFADYGTDMRSGRKVHGDPAHQRGKPGSGFGYGVGIRIDSSFGPLRIDYAVNESKRKCVHIGLGYHE